MFPNTRLRRNRKAEWSRQLVQETRLSPQDLILPLFVREEEDSMLIPSMPGVLRYTIDELRDVAQEAATLGIPAVSLFPKIPAYKKDALGTESTNEKNLLCQAIKTLKSMQLPLGIIADVALDPYTDHGHDGILWNGDVDNDRTLEALALQSLALAHAGVDVIAPSDMMDGRIGYLREKLDDNGFSHVQILAYSAKYASAFYGPFRDAVGSSSLLKGGKKTYQMDPANRNEALHEVELDIAEGADMVMVKPGLPYLDILYQIKETFKKPTFIYQVSGEYSMIQAAAHMGWVNGDQIMHESLLSMKRAGADGIFTYGAITVARQLLEEGV